MSAPRPAAGLAVWGLALGLGASATAGAPAASTLRVFAAASLSEAFQEMARVFEQAHPGTAVRLNLAGSQQLASQVELGARADVFASADERWLDCLKERSLIAEDDTVFAHNRLVAIVPRANPARIGKLSDLARRGVKVVLGAEAAPVGRYSREALQKLSAADGYPADYARRVLGNVVSEEENVRSVVGKVQLGEADAGLVYRSDVTPSVSRYVNILEIPDSANVLARYPIGVLAGTPEEGAARAFVALVLSPAGQGLLARHGLIPVGPTAP